MSRTHRNIIEEGLAELVRKINLQHTRLMEILISKGVISMDDANDVTEEYRTERQKIKAILTIVSKGSKEHYYIFRDALRACNQEHIIKEYLPDPYTKPSQRDEPKYTFTGILEEGKDFYTKTKEQAYKVTGKSRGRALILTMTDNRQGWEADVAAMTQLFNYLNVEATSLIDTDLEGTRKALDEFAESEKNQATDSVFVVLMGHGGTDGTNKEYLLVKDGPLYIYDEMRSRFNNKNRNLVNKPKVFITQMCRGTNKDEGVAFEVDAAGDARRMPTWSDFLFSYPCLPGDVARRHMTDGSLYIQELVKVFYQDAHKAHILELLTTVNRRVCAKEGIAMQTPAFECALTSLFYLYPGIKPE